MTDPDLDENRPPRNVPTFFTIKDVLTILVPVVAVASAFFTYGTRITVMEQNIATLQHHETEVSLHDQVDHNAIVQLQLQTRELETRVGLNAQQLKRVQEISRQLDKVADVQRERLEWANRELAELKADMKELE